MSSAKSDLIICLLVIGLAGCGGDDDSSPATTPSATDEPTAALVCLRGAGAYVESIDVPDDEGPHAPYRELRVRMPRGTIGFVGYYERENDARRARRIAVAGKRGNVVSRSRVVAVFSGAEGPALRRCIGI